MTCLSCFDPLYCHARPPPDRPPIRTIARECSVAPGVQVRGLRYRITGIGSPCRKSGERCMNKYVTRLLMLAMFSMALVAAPVITTVYAAPDNDAPPPSSTK